ncbi:Ppx/GppA family phosphatase [Geomicrobium sp. JCM 19039]|uniref:Ppx/GppA family phosphatase n=1 Tax=Geomicrobium sp. JCM 19039 TaxID=1460636 RepID=UPI00045F3507|nr:Ppx/GppA family phosphatase [Geomicrobium sp. JCM 19039]GAK11489.1 exopolyphosphatase [Geomicrobium sp. JCM 19039]
MNETKRMAVVDVGSNSIRLVIYAIDEQRRYRSLYNFKIAARLSEYLDEHDVLRPEGIRVLDQVFVQFNAVLRAHEVSDVKAVATAAIRRAQNRSEILESIYEKTAIEINVITGQEEAYYGYLATVNSIQLKDGLIFDMGGSSTEVAYFKDRELVHSHSFSIGALTLAKLWSDDPASIKRVKKLAHDAFVSIPWLQNLNVPLIGIGGSVRQIAAVQRRRHQYPVSGLHQYEMNDTQLLDTYHYLKKIPRIKRGEVSGLSEDRASSIVPAGLFISELMHYTKGKRLIISRKGLRDGLLYDSLLSDRQTRRFVNVKKETITQLMREFNLSTEYGKAIYALSRELYNCIYANEQEEDQKNMEELLYFSSLLRQLGTYIDEEHAHAHTLNVLTNRSLDGFSHQERISMALLSSFTSVKRLRKRAIQYKRILNGRTVRKLEVMGAILRMATSLYVTGRDVIEKIELKNTGRSRHPQFIFHVKKGEPYYFEQQHTTLSLKQLERATKTKYRMLFVEHQPTEESS